MDLNVSTHEQDGHMVVSAAGEVDLHTAPHLESELAERLRSDRVSLIVDLSGVGFCDSTGVNVLLAAMRRANDQGGSLTLVAPQPAVRKVLGITGLDSVFPIRDSVEHVINHPPASGP